LFSTVVLSSFLTNDSISFVLTTGSIIFSALSFIIFLPNVSNPVCLVSHIGLSTAGAFCLGFGAGVVGLTGACVNGVFLPLIALALISQLSTLLNNFFILLFGLLRNLKYSVIPFCTTDFATIAGFIVDIHNINSPAVNTSVISNNHLLAFLPSTNALCATSFSTHNNSEYCFFRISYLLSQTDSIIELLNSFFRLLFIKALTMFLPISLGLGFL